MKTLLFVFVVNTLFAAVAFFMALNVTKKENKMLKKSAVLFVIFAAFVGLIHVVSYEYLLDLLRYFGNGIWWLTIFYFFIIGGCGAFYLFCVVTENQEWNLLPFGKDAQEPEEKE